MSNLENNNINQSGSYHIQKLIEVLPANCTCPICIETKTKIKNEIGEKEFITQMRRLGKNHFCI